MKSPVPLRRLIVVFLTGTLFITAIAADNPYDKFRNRTLSNKGYISEQQEMELGAQVHQQLLQQQGFKLVQNAAINNYVNTLGQKLAAQSKRPNIPWNFYVVDDPSINAFATLGGRVYIHTGLLNATQSEAQLASVMGHEIGHIVGRHGLENVKKARKYGTIATIGVIAGAVLGGQGGADIANLAGNLVLGGKLMKHSRDAEREADYLGVYDMNQAGYNTGGMVEMFEILNQVAKSQPNALGNIMASHPPASERAANTEREIKQHLQGSDNRGINNTVTFQQIKGGRAAQPTKQQYNRGRVRQRN